MAFFLISRGIAGKKNAQKIDKKKKKGKREKKMALAEISGARLSEG